jgi:excisionase family DNA binding protein
VPTARNSQNDPQAPLPGVVVVELLTVPEVMTALRLSRAKIYDLIRSGELVTVKVGRCRRVPPAAVAAYVARLVEDAA